MRSWRTARGNRLGLALVALALLVPAGYAVLRGTGQVPGHPAPVVPASLREVARSQSWFWPVVAAGAGLVAVLALRWLLMQARTGRESRLVLDEDLHGATAVDARALASTAAGQVALLPGVRRARAAFGDGRAQPRLWITVTTDEPSDIGRLRAGLLGVLADVRQTLEADSLPAWIRLRPSRRRRRAAGILPIM